MASNSRLQSRSRRSPLRAIALGCVGLTLAGAAYQVAFAGDGGPQPNYGRDRGDDDSDTTATIAIGVAGAAIVGGAVWYMTRDRGEDNEPPAPAGSPPQSRERLEPLPETVTDISEIRLVPASSSLEPGYSRALHLEARSAQDGQWYSVTNRPEARIRKMDAAKTPLVNLDGYPNIFCHPLASAAGGDAATIEGTFVLPNRQPLRATATIRLQSGEAP